jgi:hypothetical protein
MSTADIVDKWSADAFFTLQRIKPGIMYASVSKTFCKAIKNIFIFALFAPTSCKIFLALVYYSYFLVKSNYFRYGQNGYNMI